MRRRALLTFGAVLFLVAFLLAFAVTVDTSAGLHADAALFRRVSGNGLPQIHAIGGRALSTIDGSSVVIGALATATLALAGGHLRRAIAAVGVIAGSLGTAEFLKHELPFPAGRPPTFPSGHAAIAVSLGLALVLAAPPSLRGVIAVLGASYGAAVAESTLVLGWHYPSDAVGSFLISGFWGCLGALVAGATPELPTVSFGGKIGAVLVLATGLIAAIALARTHPAGVTAIRSREALLATAVGLSGLSVVTFGIVTPLIGDEEDPKSHGSGIDD